MRLRGTLKKGGDWFQSQKRREHTKKWCVLASFLCLWWTSHQRRRKVRYGCQLTLETFMGIESDAKMTCHCLFLEQLQPMAEVPGRKFICAKLSAGKHFSATQGERRWRLEVEILGEHSARSCASDGQGGPLCVFLRTNGIYFSATAGWHSRHMEV